jgi:uracil-DNA glycosylase
MIHMTDAVKCGNLKNQELIDLSSWARCRGLLEAEIRLVRPKLMVAMGWRAYRAVVSMTHQASDDEKHDRSLQLATGAEAALRFRVVRMYHYSYVGRRHRGAVEWEQQVETVRDLIPALGIGTDG